MWFKVLHSRRSLCHGMAAWRVLSRLAARPFPPRTTRRVLCTHLNKSRSPGTSIPPMLDKSLAHCLQMCRSQSSLLQWLRLSKMAAMLSRRAGLLRGSLGSLWAGLSGCVRSEMMVMTVMRNGSTTTAPPMWYVQLTIMRWRARTKCILAIRNNDGIRLLHTLLFLTTSCTPQLSRAPAT